MKKKYVSPSADVIEKLSDDYCFTGGLSTINVEDDLDDDVNDSQE